MKKVFKPIGQKMMSQPDLREDSLRPFKSHGVLEINDVRREVRVGIPGLADYADLTEADKSSIAAAEASQDPVNEASGGQNDDR